MIDLSWFWTENKNQPAKNRVLKSGNGLPYSLIHINNEEIDLTNELTHLGFYWKNDNNNPNLLDILKSHIHHRVNEFLAATYVLISEGVRCSHPNTLVTLFNTLLMPKLSSGIALCDISKALTTYLNLQRRIALKYLFNVSSNILQST